VAVKLMTGFSDREAGGLLGWLVQVQGTAAEPFLTCDQLLIVPGGKSHIGRILCPLLVCAAATGQCSCLPCAHTAGAGAAVRGRVRILLEAILALQQLGVSCRL
jgi:hypothetical protein